MTPTGPPICTNCLQPIAPDDLVIDGEGMRIEQADGTLVEHIPADPYHRTCLDKVRAAAQHHATIQAQKRDDHAREKHERMLKLASDLAHRQGFLGAAREFLKETPMYYDKGKNWWLWNHQRACWELVDETDILNIVKETYKLFGDVTVKSRTHMLEALKQEARRQSPKPFPTHWVQCRDTIVDINTGEQRTSTPEYFSTNTIPWKLSESTDTPVMDRLFTEWVGEEHKQTLYEIAAYCMYADYPIHVLFCFVGTGRNGKSKYQQLIEKFVGAENVSSADLEAVCDPNNRFERFNLYKKLVCLMGETNFDLLKSTSNLKRLTGQDLIKFEAKNKDPIMEHNYAKIIISTNALPTSQDTSEGFYRRWVIIDFPNEFGEGKDILREVTDAEYEALATKSVQTLRTLLANGEFTGQGTISERRQRYIDRSNPLMSFVKDYCVVNEDAQERYSLFFTKFSQYLKHHKRRIVSRKEFTALLEMEGHEIRRTTLRNDDGTFENGVFILGLRLKSAVMDFETTITTTTNMHDMYDMQGFTTTPPYIGPNSKSMHIVHIAHQTSPSIQISALEKSPFSGLSALATPAEVQNCLKVLGSCTLEDIERVFPGDPVQELLATLISNGTVIENPAGTYRLNGA